MSGETFTDAFMLEIFRAEVETHIEALTSGLLALERDPSDTSHIDSMMRGAHSIKGAARIVGIDPAVRVAHVMEDGFIAAQNGKLMLSPDHVDVLLRGVDILNRMAAASKDTAVDWKPFEAEAVPLVAEITAVLHQSSAATCGAGPVERSSVSPPAMAQVAVKPMATTVNELTIVVPQMLDVIAAESARREFISAVDARAAMIHFDLSQTKDLDASGLAFLAAVPKVADQAGLRVELQGVSLDVGFVLDATGVAHLYSAERA